MNLRKASKKLNIILKEKQPESFSSSWIFSNAQSVYHFVRLNHRTENGDIDWDVITKSFSRRYQKRWCRYNRKYIKTYADQEEVNRILERHQKKLYVLMAPTNEKERNLRNRIIISFVRIAQKGNTLAQDEAVTWVSCILEDWIDKYWQICRWKGYTDEVNEKIIGCVRRYRYTGSFIGYLFKTLEYSARGKPPQCSLDDTFLDGDKTRIDFIVQDNGIVDELDAK